VAAPALARSWAAVADVTVVRGGALGDFVVALPALRALAGPARRLHLVGNAEAALALAPELFASVASIDDPAWAGLFDDAVALPEPRGAAVALLRAHAEPAARLRAAGWAPILDAPSFPGPSSDEHVAAHLLRMVAPAGHPGHLRSNTSGPRGAGSRSRFGHPGHPGHLPGHDSHTVGRLIDVAPDPRPRPYAVLHPGSGSPRKNWPAARFAEVARRAERAGLAPLILRGAADQAPAAALAGAGGWPVASGLGLRDLAGLLAGASLYVGNDSGVSHVAGAVGAPTVAVFGPTRALRWRPLGRLVAAVEPPSRCQRCRAAEERPVECGCLATVEVDAVLLAARRLTGLAL
jgi:heptosyltransferase-3